MEVCASGRWNAIASWPTARVRCFWIDCFIRQTHLITTYVANAASLRKPSPPKSQLPCTPGCFAEAVACLALCRPYFKNFLLE